MNGLKTYYNQGNVGIGLTDPLSLLVIHGQDGYATHFYNGANKDTYLRSGSNGFVDIRNEAMRITNAGDVGIGITNPDGKLDVNGSNLFFGSGTSSIKLGTLTLREDNIDALLGIHSSGFGVLTLGWDASADRAVIAADDGGGPGQDIAFITNAGSVSGGDNLGTAVPKMIVKGDGNVGIGTDDPDERLEVSGKLKVEGGASGSHTAGFIAPTGQGVYLGFRGGDFGSIQATNSTSSPGSGDLILQLSGGNIGIGIGSDTPSAQLDVAGNLNFTGQKVCHTVNAPFWHDSTLVPADWTGDTCSDYSAAIGGLQYQLGCVFSNSFSLRASQVLALPPDLPVSNCGW